MGIETRRKHVNFGVGEAQKIQAWEAQVGRDGTPLLAFYKNWKKISDIQRAKKVSNQEKMDDYSHIPALKKNHKKIRMKMDQSEEVSGFLSGSDDDFDEEENFKLKEDRGKKRKSENASDDESEEEESPMVKKTKSAENIKAVKGNESDSEDGQDAQDEVEDLKLEDLESDSEIEMNDEFEEGGDDSDDEDDDD